MDEKEFYRNGNVSVTSARFLVGTNTYAMNGVTSVKRGQHDPSTTGHVVLGLVSIAAMFKAEDVGLIAAGIVLLLAILWYRKLKPEYIVFLNSSSGESQALRSKDKLYIDQVIAALNESIVFRG